MEKTMSGVEAYEAAVSLARGVYQERIARGEARWSGADLKGKAASWGTQYRRSRESWLLRVRKAGIPVQIDWSPRGLLFLVYGSHNVVERRPNTGCAEASR